MIGGHQTDDVSQGDALSGAGASQDDQCFSLLYLQVESIEDRSTAEFLVDIFEADHDRKLQEM